MTRFSDIDRPPDAAHGHATGAAATSQWPPPEARQPGSRPAACCNSSRPIRIRSKDGMPDYFFAGGATALEGSRLRRASRYSDAVLSCQLQVSGRSCCNQEPCHPGIAPQGDAAGCGRGSGACSCASHAVLPTCCAAQWSQYCTRS